ncbi:MAG: hypothetical protein ABIG66_04000 [Candidatus Kerfeldbacteria bacterium]
MAKFNNRAKAFVFSLIICAALAVGFGVIYFNDSAWGTWGDDSAGYIFLAGRMWEGEPLVYLDELAAKGLEFFGDEKLARWLTPTHHQFINTRGVIASKYPVGAPMLLLVGAALTGKSEGFYLVTPALAAANLVLFYFLAVLVIPRHRYRHFIGLLSAGMLGLSELYYNYAIAQPMREIPSVTFLLLIAILLLRGIRLLKNTERKKAATPFYFIFAAGLAFGMAFNIRETSALILPGAALYVLLALWPKKESTQKYIKQLALVGLSFFIAAAVAVIPTALNSYNISQDKEVFKARDTSNVVVLPNIGHVESLSVQNLFDNQGKFRPGTGSLPHYWGVMQDVVPVPYFLVFVALGIFFLWKESRPKTALLVGWAVGILIIFSIWVNPYSRYIIPMFPPMIFLGVYGLFGFFQELVPKLIKKRWAMTILALGVSATFLVAYQPVFADVKENLKIDVHRYKAISHKDLETLIDLGDELVLSDQPVLMFSGVWQYGTSETLEAHTGLKTVRFPLEQRFDFNEGRVNEFFVSMLSDGYTLYVWVDETSSPELFTWLEMYDTNLVDTLDFTFQPQVRIYEVRAQR